MPNKTPYPKNSKPLFIKGRMKEEREGFGENTQVKHFDCIARLTNEILVVEKKSFFGKMDRGEKKILYRDINTVEYDKGGILSEPRIKIHTQGLVLTLKNRTKEEEFKSFYNALFERVHLAKTGQTHYNENNNINNNNTTNSTSNSSNNNNTTNTNNINNNNNSNNKNSTIQKDEEDSEADELLKWYNLKEKGIITEEEFEQKKRKLL